MNGAGPAEKRGVTHQTMRLVLQLDGDGLARQDADPADRRSCLVSIASAGQDTLAREKGVRTAWIEAAIRTQLSPDDYDLLRAAIALLDRLAVRPE